jgi:UDP-4-amino-4,6-dideoxy-N-acetyl-beta-L-altrosamine N-acetyltransferase
MIISGYSVVLSRLTIADIETVRKWRNSDLIRQFMEFREEITEEMQQKWFHSIDNINNNYYIIHDGENKIGLIYGAEIDWTAGITHNGGIFIAEDEYWNTYFPLSATLLLMEISFILGLKQVYVKILKDNYKAIQFNTNIGFKILPDQEKENNQKYVLTLESYEEKTLKLRQLLKKVYTDKITIIINHPDDHVSKKAIEDYKIQPEHIKNRVEFIINENYS